MPRLECPSVSTETPLPLQFLPQSRPKTEKLQIPAETLLDSRRIIEVATDTTKGLDYSALLGMVARRVQHTPPDHNSRYQ